MMKQMSVNLIHRHSSQGKFSIPYNLAICRLVKPSPKNNKPCSLKYSKPSECVHDLAREERIF